MYVEKEHTQWLPHWMKDADGGKRQSSTPNTTTTKFDFHYPTCESSCMQLIHPLMMRQFTWCVLMYYFPKWLWIKAMWHAHYSFWCQLVGVFDPKKNKIATWSRKFKTDTNTIMTDNKTSPLIQLISTQKSITTITYSHNIGRDNNYIHCIICCKEWKISISKEWEATTIMDFI